MGIAVIATASILVACCIVLPLIGAAARVAFGVVRSSPLPTGAPGLGAGTWRLLISSIGWSALIATLSTVFACAAAWTLWRAGRVARAALVAPLLVPSTLAFAGWGLLRAPDTWLGAWLEQAAQRGWHEAPVVAGRLLAVLGLSLWACPLGAIVIWSGLRATDPTLIESLRADGASPFRVARELARLCRGDILRAAGVVALVMLGSAVPLHLSQVETLAIQVWFALDNLPREQQWRAWAAAWPLVAIAVGAGWWMGGQGARFDSGEARGGGGARRRGDLVAGAIPWALGVVVPLGLFIAHIGHASALPRFWENNGGAIARSLETAAAVAAGTLVLGVATGWALSLRGFWAGLATFTTRLSLISGLLPGVQIGSAMSGLVIAADSAWLEDSLLPVIGAHLARFGFLGALAGCWGANAARRLTGDPARLDGADGWAGWWRASLWPVFGVHLAAAGAAGILSLHEIEATVQVMPPGDCLARVILGDLHYSRVADMSAAGIWLLGAGLLPVLAVALWGTWRRGPE